MSEQSATVYVRLVDELVSVYRPVAAEPVAPMIFRLVGPVPESESWEFQPGEMVLCEEQWLSGGYCLVAASARSLR
jgi:hypothetical protein